MTRRLLGPFGGPIAFFLVAGLVFAGLGWVTVAALRVEEAQREAARRADREKELRHALTRMDTRVAPALAVEDTRPFHEFKTFAEDDPITIYGPAAAPLLAGDLPEWMQLHFQLDPEAGWDSPQVLNRSTRLALRRHWPELPLRNSTRAREEQLAAINSRFPARAAAEAFAVRERTQPTIISPPAAPPLSFNDARSDDGAEMFDAAPSKQATPPPPAAPVSAPKPIPAAASGTEAKLPTNDRDLAAKSKFAEDKPVPADDREQLAKSDARKNRGLDQNRMTGDARESLFEKAFNDVARFQYQLIPNGAQQSTNGMAQKKNGPPQAKLSADAMAGRSAGEAAATKRDVDAKPGLAEFKSDADGFYRLMAEARSRELERKQLDNLHRGGLKKEADRKDTLGDMSKGGSTLLVKPSSNAPAPAAGAAPPLPGLPGSGGLGGGFGIPPAAPGGPPPGAAGGGSGAPPAPPREPENPTPDPAPAPMLLPADPPAIEESVAVPVAVHLGTLRPQWLAAADGTPLLVLVRTARVENKKTLYQGVVLDWAKLQDVLLDEVRGSFPEAKLEPVKETPSSREQTMTALPVRLDPGAESELPPAGWTPLRIGLVLAWVAALIAFAAVGLTGRSLVDLAERRIRFVSAVTHELRTPLTSLRLYLDLLLSGMVQDEDKRREYLSTLNVESDRLHRLIDNVLDFAKLERSRKGRDLQPVKAADLVDSIRLTWMDRVAADGKELVVESALPADLGLTTDGSLVQQIVGNLIDNARKYTRDASDVRIRLRAIVDGPKLVMEVEDRGCGVSPREQKTIFRPFRRGESADTKAGGAGLGLALSKEWAEVLGGRLSYRTPEGGVGSCFRLELPAK